MTLIKLCNKRRQAVLRQILRLWSRGYVLYLHVRVCQKQNVDFFEVVIVKKSILHYNIHLLLTFPLQLGEDELREAVLLVFANKQDLPNAMSGAEITEKLGLGNLRNKTVSTQ